MVKRFFVLIFFIFPISNFAQKVNIDSLWKVWNNPKQPDTSRLKAIDRINWAQYVYSQPDSAFYYADVAYKLATKKNLKKYQAHALNVRAVLFKLKGDMDKALELHNAALKLQEEISDKKGKSTTLNNLGIIYGDRGDNAKAIHYYTESLKIKDELGDKRGSAMTLNNIGVIYEEQNENDKALEYYTKSLRLAEEIGNKKGIASSMNNIGGIYQNKKDYSTAIEYYLKGVELRREIKDRKGEAMSLGNLGGIYRDLNDHEKSMDYFSQSLKIREELGDKQGIATSLGNIAMICYDKKDYVKASEYAKRSLALAKEAGVKYEVKNASQSLYLIYKNSGKHKDALEMHELFISTRDSILSEENQKGVIEQETKYKYEKQKALDEKEHEKEIAIAEEQKKKQRILIFSIAAGLILVLLFTFFVINRLRITNRQKKIIEAQKRIVEEQKHEVEVQKQEVEHQKELVEEKQQEIIDSITYAKRLQNAILPPKNYIDKYLPGNFVLYQPKDIVAGDFYWMETIRSGERGVDDELILIAAADSTGHGVPGALVSIVCSNALNKSVKEFKLTKPGEILFKTREIVLETFAKSGEEIKDGMDISLLCIDKTNKKISWSGANNQLWYILNNELVEVKADKQPVGKADRLLPFTTNEIAWEPGTIFYLMTDGYPDQFGGPKGKKFKYKQLEELLVEISSLDPEEQKKQLLNKFSEWRGQLEQVDDVTIIGVRI